MIETEDGDVPLDADSAVSMNMWGIQPQFFRTLESGFKVFLETLPEDENKAEYLLPTIIGNLLKEDKVQVKVIESTDKWFGVTYRADKATVVAEVQALVDVGVYPEKLFG